MQKSISKDVLSTFDPSIKDYYVKDGLINLVLEDGAMVINFKQQELELLMKELKENS